MSTTDERPQLSAAKRALLEQRLRKAKAPAEAGIPRRPAGEAPPLSPAQERLWFMEQFAPGTAAYGDPLLVELGADYDAAAFRSALRDLTERHESLRMRFPESADGRPTVVVGEPWDIPVAVLDVPDETALDAEVDRLSVRSFDLAEGPLFRADVLRLAAGASHFAVVDMHHSVTDGWSNETVLTDLAELYRARRAGTAPDLPPAPLGYGDFARWQRDRLAGPDAARHLAYWKDKLAGVPLLELPTDLPRPPVQSFDGASHHFRLDAGLVAGLTELSQAHRATLFMTMLAAYQTLLSRYTGQTDFAVGSPVAGRSHPDLDRTVGMFVNMLPIRADLDGDPSGAELLDRVRLTVLEALSHEEMPFERVVEDLGVPRDVQRSAVFQVMFVLQNYEFRAAPRMVDEETAMGWRPVELPATRFDLELHAYAAGDGGLECRFVYNTALFRPESIARIQRHFSTMLRDLVARPAAAVSELAMADAAEHQAIELWNGTEVTRGPAATLPGLIAERTGRTPDAVAVVDADRSLSYRELDEAAEALAHRLAAHGVGAEHIVGVCAERSVDLVVALLGVLKAGAAYLPLDPEYPADRLAYMIEDSGARVLLAQPGLRDRLPDTGAEVDVLLVQDQSDEAAAAVSTVDSDLVAAYLIYTSGSTGRPKGVLNSHRGIVNRLRWMQSAFQLGPDDVVLQKTPAGFDVSVWEFFWPLIQGARLVLARPGEHRDPAALRDVIAEHGITTLHFVPSMLDVFLSDAGGDRCESIRRIVCSGEELPAALARRCVEAMPWAGLHNLYGPTEAAVDVTSWACEPAALAGIDRVPIGSPVDNTRIYVLDEAFREVPSGGLGQLHIGGVQVSRGYHRRPGLTAERFVPDPYGPPGARMYATGDLARRRADGDVEFLGRIDGQVKLRGLRIELGEIEAVLREQPGVRSAAVAVKEPTPGDKRIVGYLVGDEPDLPALRAALGARLPDYMVPAAFVSLTELPLSPNGKLDRKALPLPEIQGVSDQEYAEPETDLEKAIAAVWREVLGVERVGLDDDFFALGGHSLLATQVAARLRSVTATGGRRVSVVDLFQNKTVRALAAFIGGEASAGPRRLLYELTGPVAARDRQCSYVCVPYGGGSAIVYQPIADALPAGHSLFSIAIPGHDVGLDEEPLAFDELAERCRTEILERVEGPLVLYGHCGVGGALIVEVARRLEAAGRELEAVYVGGIFPFAKPRGLLSRFQAWTEDLTSNKAHANWLKSMGVGMDELDPEQADRIISNMRQDGHNAEDHFTALLDAKPAKLRAPIISVVGERDPVTDYYRERYREWRFIADTAAVVVLDEAGHFFLRFRAGELVDIITTTHKRLDRVDGPPQTEDRPRWWLEDVAAAGDAADPGVPAGSGMGRFLTVAGGQLVSAVGSGLTGFAIPVWILQKTGSLGWFGLTGVMAVLPMLLLMPAAGVVADRADRRKVLMAAGVLAGGVELALATLLHTGHTALGLVYAALMLIVGAGTFQRVTFMAAIPQLAPKRYLGQANGIAQTINSAGLLFAPLLAAGLYAAIGLSGILTVDIISYAFAVTVLAVVRFPNLLGWRRRESFWTQVLGGVGLSWRVPGFRAMLIFFGVGNLLYAAPILLVTPLVLSFANLTQVGEAAVAEGLGAVVGGFVLTVWGGPARRRMPVIMTLIAVSGGFVMLTGLRPALPVVLVGLFGTAATLSVSGGIYMTIIQTKVPQRFHGRVFALNQSIAWATIPLGFAVFVPFSGSVLNPLLTEHGALAGSVGALIGTGPGRGLGLAYLVFGLAMALNALIGLRIRILRDLDEIVPDAEPDDLIGMRAIDARTSQGTVQDTPEKAGV